MTCSLSRTMMPTSFNLHLQCQEAILPSWRKLFPHMAELPPEVNHEERRRYRKSTFLFLRMFVPQHGMEHLACLPPSQATSPPFPAWPSLMGSTTPLNVLRIIIKKLWKHNFILQCMDFVLYSPLDLSHCFLDFFGDHISQPISQINIVQQCILPWM